MKFIYFLVSLFLSSSVFSADVFDLAFPNPIKIYELARVVYGEMLEQNYILEPDLIKDETAVICSIRNLSKKTVDLALRNILEQQGFRVSKIDGVNYIRKSTVPVDFDLYYYRPKFRSASYLIGLSSSLFTEGYFVSSRSVRSGSVTGLPINDKKSSAISTSSISQIDVDADVIIFRGTKKEIELLKNFLFQVDIPVGEVQIKAVVFEVGSTMKEGSAAGLAMNILSGKIGVSFGKGSIGESVTVKFDSIDAVFSALSSDARFRVISSPSIRVKSGSHGFISVGSDVPVLGSVSYDNTGHPIQSVKMMSSGVILDLTPTVTDSGFDLVVRQQISSFVPTTTGVNSSPTLIKREISTVVGASFNEIVILGGLNESKLNQDISGLSFLPKWLYSSGTEDVKSEILLVLQVQKVERKL